MSSPPPTRSTTTIPTAVLPHHHHTYWCHVCDMSILLPQPAATLPLAPPPPPRCPHCRHDFLEYMDSFTPTGPSTETTTIFSDSIWGPPVTPANFPFFPLPPNSIPTAPIDNFLLDSPYLQSLIRHLTSSAAAAAAAGFNIFYDPAPVDPLSSPASKTAIDSIKTIKIDNELLEKDPIINCPICKDQFGFGCVARELPCKHIFHTECIVPWLEINNTCPLCRFELPTEEDELDVGLEGGESYVGAMRLDELIGDDDDDNVGEDLLGFRRVLRRIERGEEWYVDGSGNGNEGGEEFVFSPSQIGEAGSGVVERANSVETVSSWPVWQGEGEREVGVGDDGHAVRS